MKTYLQITLILFLNSGWLAANSQFSLFLDGKGSYPAPLREKLEEFLRQTEAKIPPAVQAAIGRKISVSFAHLDNYTSVVVPPCPKTLDEYHQSIEVFNHGSAIYGSTRYSMFYREYYIVLNANLIPVIERGEDSATTMACRLKNMYKMAEGALIHEIGHVFDQETPSPRLSRKDEIALQTCRQQFHKEQGNEPYLTSIDAFLQANPSCKAMKKDQLRSQTDWRQLKNLAGWHKSYRWQRRVLTNILSNRSPTAQERESISEFFAVNFAYWLLDKEYFARRPGLAFFFETLFHHQPFADRPKPVSKISTFKRDVFDSNPSFVDISPERVYQIHLLTASPGKSVQSWMGHTMVRFVLCDPKRRAPSSECLADIDHHVVLNVYADVREKGLNYLEVLQGRYQAMPFFVPFNEVTTRYNKEELRHLWSQPLAFNRDEITLFTYAVLEELLAKRVNYDYYQKNCATRVLAFLKAAFFNKRIQDEFPLTPNGLVQTLEKHQLLAAKSEDPLHYFPSDYDKISSSYFYIKGHTQLLGYCSPELFDEKTFSFTLTYNYKLRHACFAEVMARQQRDGLIMAFYDMERFALRKIERFILDKLTLALHDDSGRKDSELSDEERELKKILAIIKSIHKELYKQYQVNLSFESYGIPLAHEQSSLIIDEARFAEVSEQLTVEIAKAQQLVQTLLKEDFDTLLAIHRQLATIARPLLVKL